VDCGDEYCKTNVRFVRDGDWRVSIALLFHMIHVLINLAVSRGE
jgi:hypothetical protein